MDTRPFRILLLGPAGKKRTAQFSTEAEAVEFLKATYRTEAPLSFEYLDGSPVEVKAIERMYRRMFGESEGGKASSKAA